MTTSPLPSLDVPRPTAGPGAGPPAARHALDLSVADAVRARLRERGWAARTEVLDVCGELDVRLHVTCPGSPVQVELLGAYPAQAPAVRWCAVRITPWSRAVWRGPHLGCPPDELVAFLEALNEREVAQLADHRQALS